jgi:hypothetical protein
MDGNDGSGLCSAGEACVTFCAGNTCPADVLPCKTDGDCSGGDSCSGGCCIPPPPAGGGGSGGSGGSDGSGGSNGGACPPGSKVFVDPSGMSTCMLTPTNGTCPPLYVVTILNNQQYCTLEQIK